MISMATGGNGTPTRSSVTPMRPPSRSISRLSAAHASMQPPAMAWPLIAATTGAGWEKTVASIVLSAGRNLRTYVLPPSTRRLRSTPAENMCPVPVSTTARALDSAAKRSVSAWQNSMLMALALPLAKRSSTTPSRPVTSITSPAPVMHESSTCGLPGASRRTRKTLGVNDRDREHHERHGLMQQRERERGLMEECGDPERCLEGGDRRQREGSRKHGPSPQRTRDVHGVQQHNELQHIGAHAMVELHCERVLEKIAPERRV